MLPRVDRTTQIIAPFDELRPHVAARYQCGRLLSSVGLTAQVPEAKNA